MFFFKSSGLLCGIVSIVKVGSSHEVVNNMTPRCSMCLNQALRRMCLWGRILKKPGSRLRGLSPSPGRVRTYARFSESTRALRPQALLEILKEDESKFRNGNQMRNMFPYFSTDPVNILASFLWGPPAGPRKVIANHR